jgi:hypothetical protein
VSQNAAKKPIVVPNRKTFALTGSPPFDSSMPTIRISNASRLLKSVKVGVAALGRLLASAQRKRWSGARLVVSPKRGIFR